MPELQWDELDFLECLEVVPLVEEEYGYEICRTYEIHKDALALTVLVRPLSSVIWLSLRQQEHETPLVEFAFFARGKVRHINDKRGNYLEFADCFVAPSRFSDLIANEFLSKDSPQWTVELSIKPQISIRYRE